MKSAGTTRERAAGRVPGKGSAGAGAAEQLTRADRAARGKDARAQAPLESARGAIALGRQVRCMNQETGFQKTPRNGGQTDTSGLPRPLRRFADRLDEVRSAEIFDMDRVGRGSGGAGRRGTWRALAPGNPGRDNR